VLESVFVLMGNAFPCGALVLTGSSIVGKMGEMRGKKLAIPVFLSLMKSLLLPVLAKYLVQYALPQGAPRSKELVDFMVVFHSIPTAASTLVFAKVTTLLLTARVPPPPR
jgi:predicted permease